MTFAAPILGLVGGIVSAAGTVYQGMAQAQALNYQAKVAQNNAIMANQAAARAIEAGNAEAAKKSMEEAGKFGEIRAAEAAGGVDVNTGSNKNVQVSARELGKLDTETTMNKAQQVAYGYRTQATNYGAQAGLYSYEAPQAEIGADIGAVGQVFGAAGKWFGSPTQTA
jgi:hypothetical protein